MLGAPFAGRLISRQFTHELWRAFAGRLGEGHAPVASRRLLQWHKAVESALGPASGLTAIHDVGALRLFRLLGFELVRSGGSTDEGAIVSIASGPGTGPLPLITGFWTDRLDALTRRGVHEAVARRARWAFCFNGRGLRLIDADRPYARRYLEFDLGATALDSPATQLLWATLRSAAFNRRASTRDASIDLLVAASDAHTGQVADALQHGVHAALEALALRMRVGASRHRVPSPAIVEDALTVVYRLLFLLFAEARALVPMWNPIYRDSYSVDGLRDSCDRPAEAVGLWSALQAISRLAHEGCSTQALRVTAFNSQLFSPSSAPLVERVEIDDATMGRVLRSLTDVPSALGAARIAYADLGVEQLGTIYERVLDFAPTLEAALSSVRGAARPLSPPEGGSREAAPGGVRASRVAVSARRKESGTFYTPRSMAEHLVRATLGPLVRDAPADDILRLRVLDPAMGSGAFLVAACRFLADAYATALDREGRLARDGVPRDRQSRFRRIIAQRCLYGVDVNPVAVQLARLSLWLATLASDAPLTFLDHHLCAGDSLVGASTDELIRGWPRALRGRSSRPAHGTLPLFDTDVVTETMRGLMPTRARLCGPDLDVAGVRDKETALRRSLTEGALPRFLALADAWCARWFWGSTRDAPPASAWHEIGDYVVRGSSALPPRVLAGWMAETTSAAARHRFLHWPLRFPEVFFDEGGVPRADGGFDAIVGNPPWDMVRGDSRDVTRKDESRKESAALSTFVRESGLYATGGDAHVNRYQLFVERALALARPGGRIGLIVPWGLAGDVASAGLRRRLFERCDTDSIVAFDNADGLFPIHRSVRFLLVTTSTGRPTSRTSCRLGERSLDALDRAPADRLEGRRAPLILTPSWLRRVSGDGLELPYVRDARDVALLDRLHTRLPMLAARDGWSASFGRELNATDDRDLFTKNGDGMPVIGGKEIVPFAALVPAGGPVIGRRHAGVLLHRLPSIARHRVAYRDVASPTNRVTLIAAVLPPHVVSTHTLFCLKSPIEIEAQYCLCALLNSLVANYLVRLRVTTHVTVAMVSRLPVPRPVRGSEGFEALAACARTLEDVARKTPGAGRARDAAPCERSPAWTQLQAIAAIEYGLNEEDFDYVLSTFPLVDAEARRAASETLRTILRGGSLGGTEVPPSVC